MPAITSDVCASSLIVRAHDPQLRCRPAPRPGSIAADRICTALTWNVFQTLDLIAPAFWIRRLRARLVGLDVLDPAPVVARVACWAPLDAPVTPAQSGRTTADVLIETDHAVVGLLTVYGGDLPLRSADVASPDAVAALVDALTVRAGVRACYAGVIVEDPSAAPLAASIVDRYAASFDALRRRLPYRPDGLANLRGIGLATWSDLRAILDDCAQAPVLDDLARHAAGRAAAWMEALGIRSPGDRTPSSSARASPG